MPDDQRPIRKAVLPAAGLGTRFLPASKAIPKEMLPIVDRPTVQYIVEECVRAGLDRICMVTSAGKSAMEDHFDRLPALEAALKQKGKDDLYDEIVAIAESAAITSVRQPQPLGLGHAILMGKEFVGDDSFAVLLGDDIVHPGEPFLERMMEVHLERGRRPVVAVMEVPHEQISMYGCVEMKPTDEDDVFEVSRLVEKPPVDEAPSDLAVIGRYVLPGSIFGVIENTPPGRGGEIQVTDALNTMAQEEPILAVRLDARRFDAGDKLGFLIATVQLAAERDDLGPAFREWLTDYVAGLQT